MIAITSRIRESASDRRDQREIEGLNSPDRAWQDQQSLSVGIEIALFAELALQLDHDFPLQFLTALGQAAARTTG